MDFSGAAKLLADMKKLLNELFDPRPRARSVSSLQRSESASKKQPNGGLVVDEGSFGQ
jgi:hypothetical protein